MFGRSILYYTLLEVYYSKTYAIYCVHFLVKKTGFKTKQVFNLLIKWLINWIGLKLKTQNLEKMLEIGQ